MNDTKTAAERAHRIVEAFSDPRVIYEGHEEEMVLEHLEAHAAEARREALQEAAELARSKYPEAVEHGSFDSGLRIAGTFIAKAIEQLGDSDHG